MANAVCCNSPMSQFSLDDRPHQIQPSAFIAPDVVIIGDVKLGSNSSVWYGAVIRGDVAPISIGENTNIQDTCVLHADPGAACTIGDRVTVGHGAIVHGATVEDDVLIGMRAVVMNHAVIGSGSVIAAGAIVTEKTIIPPGSLVVGTPAKVRGPAAKTHAEMIDRGWRRYVDAGQAYRAKLSTPNSTVKD